MGTICHPKEPVAVLQKNEHSKQTIKVNDVSELKSVSFAFTTDMLIHIKADLLILFMDHTTNLRRNDHFTKLPLQGGKLEDYTKAQLARSQVPSQDGHPSPQPPFTTFNIIIPTLNFRQVSVLFCDIWRKEAHNDSQFKDQLRSYFNEMGKQKAKSIAIAEFTAQLGVHLQKGVKRIMHEIIRMQTKPETIEFVCLSEQSKAIYMETVKYHSEDVRRSFDSSNPSEESNYY